MLRVFAPHAPRTQRIPGAKSRRPRFRPPRVAIKTLRGAYALLKFCAQNFRGPSWRKQVPKTNRECIELTTIFGPPRCDQNAAWRLCFAKVSVSKIFAAQVGGSRFQRQTANATNLPQFLAPRVAIKMRRGAYASLKFLFFKIFAAQVGGSRFQKQTANATNLPQFLAPRVAIKTLRGAHALL